MCRSGNCSTCQDKEPDMMRTLIAILPPLAIVLAGLVALPFTIFGAALAFFGALDMHGRWRDYRYLSSCPPLNTRLIKYYGKSYCGRWVVITVDRSYLVVYDHMGYRWWHFLPDDFPYFFFKKNFYLNLILGHNRAVKV